MEIINIIIVKYKESDFVLKWQVQLPTILSLKRYYSGFHNRHSKQKSISKQKSLHLHTIRRNIEQF